MSEPPLLLTGEQVIETLRMGGTKVTETPEVDEPVLTLERTNMV
jgi:hypothetical protein